MLDFKKGGHKAKDPPPPRSGHGPKGQTCCTERTTVARTTVTRPRHAKVGKGDFKRDQKDRNCTAEFASPARTVHVSALGRAFPVWIHSQGECCLLVDV